MAKPKFDPNSAFKNIIGAEIVTEIEKPVEEKTINSLHQPEKPTNIIINKLDTSKKHEEKTKSKLVQKAYYITDDQHKKLRMKSAIEGTDMSTLIREALDNYLKGD